MITIQTKGKFTKTEKFLHGVNKLRIKDTLNKYGSIGVSRLKTATPKDSGDTASNWRYQIVDNKKGASITWINDSIAGSVPIVILIQYGHSTGTGGYVQGIDFINPALQSIFNKISEDVWNEVVNL